MSQRKFLNLIYAALLTAVVVFTVLNVTDLKMFVYQQGVEYHSQKILETRTIVRQKADELMYRLNNDPAAMEQTLRHKLLRQFIVACEQVPPFDQPRRSYCNQNAKVYRHYDCIRRVRLNQFTDQELYDFLAERFQTNIMLYGDFKKAMDLRIKDLDHVQKYYYFKSLSADTPASRDKYRRNHLMMKDMHAKEKELLEDYYQRAISLDEYKKLVINYKIDAMKKTPDWKQGCWKSDIVPEKKGSE